ncbi:hypothetical protein Tco_0912371 [Tanacetum coccineum]
MTTAGEPFAAPIEKEVNTSSHPNITSVAAPNTHSIEEPLNTTSELNPNDPILQFIVQNFDRINAMYTMFTHARKDVSHRSLPTSGNPSGEPWNSDSEEAYPSKALGKTFVQNDEVEPIPATPLDANNTKGKGTQSKEFYHQPFVFKDPNRDTKDLMASPFNNRIWKYDIPDGLKVPANLRTYDGMSDPDDLTIFMGTMDVHNSQSLYGVVSSLLRYVEQQDFEEDLITHHCMGDNPLVITANIGNTHLHKIYVDAESSAEIMYEHYFEQLTAEQKKELQPSTTPLVGFIGQKLWPLSLTLSDYRGHIRKTITVECMIIRAPSPYNVILGSPTMKQLGAIVSTLHSIMKFPTQDGIAVVRGETPKLM